MAGWLFDRFRLESIVHISLIEPPTLPSAAVKKEGGVVPTDPAVDGLLRVAPPAAFVELQKLTFTPNVQVEPEPYVVPPEVLALNPMA